MEVDWLKAESHIRGLPPADVILAADVVWVAELVLPFVDTLSHALQAAASAKGADVYCLLCHKTRSHLTDEMLFEGLSRKGLSVEIVQDDELHPTWKSSELVMWKIQLQ